MWSYISPPEQGSNPFFSDLNRCSGFVQEICHTLHRLSDLQIGIYQNKPGAMTPGLFSQLLRGRPFVFSEVQSYSGRESVKPPESLANLTSTSAAADPAERGAQRLPSPPPTGLPPWLPPPLLDPKPPRESPARSVAASPLAWCARRLVAACPANAPLHRRVPTTAARSAPSPAPTWPKQTA
jgi:hypothetical protein